MQRNMSISTEFWDNTDKKYPQPTEAQLKELENEDFQDGAPVRYEQMDLFGGNKW